MSERRRLSTDDFNLLNRFTFSCWIRFRLCSNKFFRVSNNICLTEGMTRKKDKTIIHQGGCIYSQEWRHSKNIFLLLPGKKSGRYVRKTRAGGAWEREAREKTRAASARHVHNKSRSSKTLKYQPLQNFFTSLWQRNQPTTWLKRKLTLLNQTS